MTGEQAVTVTYLAVSVLSLTVHAWALAKLLAAKAARPLTRTVTCRVVCSLLYIAVGLNALTRNWAPLQLALAVFCVTQATWLANSVLDKRLGTPPKTKRRRRLVGITLTVVRAPLEEKESSQ